MSERTYAQEQTQPRAQACDSDLKPLDDLLEYARQYAKQNPEVVVATVFGIGFIFGWKLKPW